MAVAPGDRSVAVGGDVRNSVIVTGDNVTLNVRLDAAEGALLDRLPQAPPFIPLPLPLDSRPRRYPNHLDREGEARAALAALEQAAAADVYGEAGIGKSHLLSHVGNLAGAGALPDGIAYVVAEGAPFDDVLQALFEEFFDPGSPPVRPSRSRLRRELRDRQALVVVDGLELGQEEARAVLEAAPGCRFLVASTDRKLWDAAPIRLEGLELAYALELVEQELARPLEPEERPDAERLCEALGGHPWRIREAVARARDEGRSLAEAARALDPTDMLDALTPDERGVLAGLAAAGGGPVGLAHLRELSPVEELEPMLESLERRHLVHSHSPRFSLAGPLLEEIEARWELDGQREHALAHYVEWSERHRGEAEVAEEQPAVLGLLRWAAATGRDGEAIRLGRAADPSLAVSGRFGSWAESVEVVLGAARRKNDREAEAWALHQRGTWAAGVVGAEVAVGDLEAARTLREQIGDRAGEAATRHNLEVVRGIAGGGGGGGGGHGPAFFVAVVLALGALIFAGVLGALWFVNDDGAATSEATTEATTEETTEETSTTDSTTTAPRLPDIDLSVRADAPGPECPDLSRTCEDARFTVNVPSGPFPEAFDVQIAITPVLREPFQETVRTTDGVSTPDGLTFSVPVDVEVRCDSNCTFTVTVGPEGTFVDGAEPTWQDPDPTNNESVWPPPTTD